MFSLHETVQRRVCRVAFLAFCIVPTLWTVGWIAHFYRPWRNDDWQRALSQRFHIQASIEGIEKPVPGVTKLARVAIADLRSQRPLGVIETLRIEQQGGRIALGSERVELSFEQLKEFSKTVETCFATTELPAINFHAKHLDIVGAGGESFGFTNLRLSSNAGGKQILLQADVVQEGITSTVQIVLETQSDPSAQSLVAKFDTQQAKLPAWLLEGLVPGLEHCDEATFAGMGTIRSGPAGSSGDLQGHFSNVDLKQWIGPLSPHRLQAKGSLYLEKLAWDANVVNLVQGELSVGVGRMDRAFLVWLANHEIGILGPPVPQIATETDNWQDFDELNCKFEFSSQGITLNGFCNTVPNQTGCLLAFAGRPLLLQTNEKIPMGNIAQVLLPFSDVGGWLPLTQQAIKMMQSLPIPSLIPPKMTERVEAESDKTIQ